MIEPRTTHKAPTGVTPSARLIPSHHPPLFTALNQQIRKGGKRVSASEVRCHSGYRAVKSNRNSTSEGRHLFDGMPFVSDTRSFVQRYRHTTEKRAQPFASS